MYILTLRRFVDDYKRAGKRAYKWIRLMAFYWLIWILHQRERRNNVQTIDIQILCNEKLTFFLSLIHSDDIFSGEQSKNPLKWYFTVTKNAFITHHCLEVQIFTIFYALKTLKLDELYTFVVKDSVFFDNRERNREIFSFVLTKRKNTVLFRCYL